MRRRHAHRAGPTPGSGLHSRCAGSFRAWQALSPAFRDRRAAVDRGACPFKDD
jgi:hypothetical protein